MNIHKPMVVLTVFWVLVLAFPMMTGIFELGRTDETVGWVAATRTGISVFGYCLMVGWAGPRLLRKLNAYDDDPPARLQRNKLWFERSMALGLIGLLMALWLELGY